MPLTTQIQLINCLIKMEEVYGFMEGGKKLVPYDTKGCIAIKTSTLKKLGAFIKPHLTPILIGSKVIQQNQNKYIVREINDIQEKNK